MAKFLRISDGVARQFSENSSPAIYEETLLVVSGSPGAGEIMGPISASTPITLPGSQTYDSLELEVYVNNERLDDVFDYNFEGSPPRTQVSLTFDLEVGDYIRFRIDRGA